MEKMDEMETGMVTEKDLKDAIIKVARENKINLNDQILEEIVTSSFMQDNGSVAKEMSRQSMRHAMESIPDIKALST